MLNCYWLDFFWVFLGSLSSEVLIGRAHRFLGTSVTETRRFSRNRSSPVVPLWLVLSINMTDPDYSDMPDLVSFETDASDSDGSESETVLERCVVCVL